ncbi:MAG: sigma-70 family RNA polymerase sigma factor [Flavobacteriales bacterium]|nr:sigma-70 family RNA polymerase sigma factor [Flavobacteriales bacterium]
MTKEEFQYCFNTYFDPIRNYIYYRCGNEDLATDIVQETFMKLWTKQLQFDKKGIKSLLYKMASDHFISTYRKSKLEEKYRVALDPKVDELDPESVYEFEELKSKYEKALIALPENQKVVFLMSRMEGLTYKEMAERLSLSVKAVEKRMNLALEKLRKELVYEH